MADVVVSDAARVPQDEGYPNLSDGNESWNSAGLMALLGQAAQSGSYARSDQELDFANHNGTNDTVDVQPGVAYISLAGETVNVQSGIGGSSASYDTTITTNTMPAVCVVLPTATTVDLQDSTLSSVWVAYATDGTVTGVSTGDIYLRSDDTGSVTAPPHPNVKLGESNPDSAPSDSLENRFASPTYNAVTADELSTELEEGSDISGSRSFNTVYQNTDGNDIYVYMRTVGADSGDNIFYISYVSQTSSGASNTDNRVWRQRIPSGDANAEISIRFRVPDGYYYQIEEAGDSVGMFAWTERGVSP